jgi:hypothetical protein
MSELCEQVRGWRRGCVGGTPSTNPTRWSSKDIVSGSVGASALNRE